MALAFWDSNISATRWYAGQPVLTSCQLGRGDSKLCGIQVSDAACPG